MNDTLRYTRNMQVIHNLHIFKRYFPNIWELAFESNIRIAEREIESDIIQEDQIDSDEGENGL